jgi:hypothetical protein
MAELRGLNAEEGITAHGGHKKSPADGRAWKGIQGCNQAWGGVLRGAAMRLRRRRLQPKAAAAPNRGRGPGTAAAGGLPRITLIVSLVPTRDQVPIRPVVVKPRLARVCPLNVALLTIGVVETYVESIAKTLGHLEK